MNMLAISLQKHVTKTLILSNRSFKLKAASTWCLWTSSSNSSTLSSNTIHKHHINRQQCHLCNHHNHHHHPIINFNYKNKNHLKRCLCTEASSVGGSVVSFNLSDIGEGISEVVIKEWFVNVGDRVQQFDNICEVQSDKASVTITSRYDGIIKKIYYKVDETAKVGLPLVDIQIESQPNLPVSTEPKPDKQEITIGNAINVDDHSQQNADIHDYLGGGKILTTPAVRRIAMEYKVNLNLITGTGRDGRILKEDVLNYINNQKEMVAQKPEPTPTFEPKSLDSVPITQPSGQANKKESIVQQDRIEPMSNVTKGMFKTMTKSLSIPHFGLSEEIDITRLVELRPEMKKINKEKNIHLTYMPFFIKAASIALNEYPILNSTIDPSNEKIIYRSSHNIGIAMDTKQGLLVPNIKNVNHLSIMGITHELNRLQELGQRGQLSLQDLQGGTFSLSNIGSIGSIFGIPVLVPNEVAIGAIGRVRQLPRFVNDDSNEIRRAHIIQVLWSADHRIIDGATMTRFCKLWKDLLENPFRLFIEL